MLLPVAFFLAIQSAQADAPSPIPLMSQEREIALAEQGGPSQISKNATVYVLARDGFRKVREGTNGCVCLVNRWAADDREPTCYSPKAVTTALPRDLREMELRQQGKTDDEIAAEIGREFLSGKLIPPEPGTVVYMMSPEAKVMNAGHEATPPPHVMFSLPYANNADLGITDPKNARQTGLPTISHPGSVDAIIAVDMSAWLKDSLDAKAGDAAVLVQLKYWAKPNKAEELRKTLAETEEAHVRAGSPAGVILRGPGKGEADFIYEVQLPNAEVAAQIHKAISKSPEIAEIWSRTQNLIVRFEDRVFVQRFPAQKAVATGP